MTMTSNEKHLANTSAIGREKLQKERSYVTCHKKYIGLIILLQ